MTHTRTHSHASTHTKTATVSNTGLLLKKLAVAFATGFLGYMIPKVLTLLSALSTGAPSGFGKTLVISAVAGAFAAGLRLALALSPINLLPTDALHTIGAKKAKAVTVSKTALH